MTAVHIYTARRQPLTRFRDDQMGRWFTKSAHALAYCHNCRRRRRAKNLVTQVYYDAVYIWCRDKCRPKARRRP